MNNKTIWITGASSGIGKALAIKFAQEGWKVAISARREELLKEISKSQKNISYFPLDVTDSEKCKLVFEEIKKKLGDIDISVFSTGIHDPKSEKTLILLPLNFSLYFWYTYLSNITTFFTFSFFA